VQELLVAFSNRPFKQHQHVHVRVQRQVTSPVPAECDDGNGLSRGWCLEEQALKKRVDAVGIAFDRVAPCSAVERLTDKLLTCRFENGRRTDAGRVVGGLHV